VARLEILAEDELKATRREGPLDTGLHSLVVGHVVGRARPALEAAGEHNGQGATDPFSLSMVDVDLAIATVSPTPTTEELELGRGADKARRVPPQVVSGHPPRGFHPLSRHMPYS
jgi:hypothetical protein